MTEGDRINRMEDHLIDMRLAVSALLETVTQHQRNFETIQGNFQTMQRNFDTVVTEIKDIRVEQLAKDTVENVLLGLAANPYTLPHVS